MWNSTLMKILRWITFIPLCVLMLGIIQILFGLLVYGISLLHLSVFWLIVIVIFGFGGLLVGLFGMLSGVISMLTVYYCPNYKVGGYILSFISLISFTVIVIRLWTIQDNSSSNIIVFDIVMTILYISLCLSIIITSLTIGGENQTEAK
jgi:hypothetical protein